MQNEVSLWRQWALNDAYASYGFDPLIKKLLQLFRCPGSQSTNTKVAVLIDGDNVSHNFARTLLDDVHQFGNIVVRRAYINQTGGGVAWTSTIAAQELPPTQVIFCNSGKNASDIALCVDAMELLLRGTANVFVVVSSDSDFTSLVMRIREYGGKAIGYGSKMTSRSYMRACSSFHFLEDIKLGGVTAAMTTGRWTLHPSDAEALLVLAVLKLAGTDGEVTMHKLGEYLSQQVPKFDSRTYRRRNLSHLVQSIDSLTSTESDRGLVVRINSKTQEPTKSRP